MAALLKYETVPVNELVARGLTPDSDHLRPIALVVDNEQLSADMIVELIGKEGVAATAVYDVASALESARIVPPNVLISNVFMPGISGIQLAISVQKEVPDCKVLLFSGQASAADLHERTRIWGHDFKILSKPVQASELLVELAKLGCFDAESIARASG